MYNFTGCDGDISRAIGELGMQLGFTVSPNGLEVHIEKCENGLELIKGQDGRVTLKYGTNPDLWRGVYLLHSNRNRDIFEVRQECAFEDLGVMLDVSRNAVLKVDTVKDIVRHLACMGYHSLQLYTEDTIEIENEEYFGYMRGALTVDEIQEIDSYCRIFDIELVPCIQTLAHLNQITRYSRYQKIIDFADILLVDEERTYELLENIFKTISKAFTSRNVNIGMDEAHMLGLGKYLDKHGYHQRFDIMVSHLNRVLELCKKYGFNPQMWSDMFFRLVYGGEYYVQNKSIPKEMFDKIPKNVKLVYWDYYSSDTARYDTMLKNHLAISDNIGFAGGAWKWTGFAPDNAYSLRTGEAALKACMDNNIKSFLLTCWGDNGAEASAYSILPSLYHCAERAYTGDFSKDGFKALTGIGFDEFMAVDLPNRLVKADYERNNASKFLLYNDVLIGTFDSLVFEGIGEVYRGHARKLRDICSCAGKYAYVFDTLQKLCDVLSIKAELGAAVKRAYDAKDLGSLKRIADTNLPELLDKLKGFYDAFSFQWHHDNKSFGFEVQCIRLGGLIARIEYTCSRLKSYIEGGITQIEELEQPRKPFAYFDDMTIEKLIYNLWGVIVSPGVM